MSDDEVTDVDLRDDIDGALSEFAALRSILPEKYPHLEKFKIIVDEMRAFERARQPLVPDAGPTPARTRPEPYWHLVNLPLVLHAYRHPKDADVKSVMGSLLKAFNEFAARFATLPGARSLLSPLWKAPWSTTPELWSVAACVYIALSFDSSGTRVLGFERKIGGGARDADLTVILKDRVTHVDVEAYHRAEFGDSTDEELEHELERRADEKAGNKFRDLPEGERGIVAVVCVVRSADVHRTLDAPLPHRPIPGRQSVDWMPLRLVGNRFPDGLRFAILPL